MDSLDERFIRRAIALAVQAKNSGNHPFGALLAVGEYVRLEAENTVVYDDDVTAHAELNLVRLSQKHMTARDRARAVLYTSTEPCAMCAGAIYWCGISRVVYSCPAGRLAELCGSGLTLGCRHVYEGALGPHKIEVRGPVLEDEGLAVHREFWC